MPPEVAPTQIALKGCYSVTSSEMLTPGLLFVGNGKAARKI
jgi:hypothetical protein